MPGYGVPESWLAATALCAAATAGDVAIVLGLFALGTLVFHEPRWFDPPRITRYLLVVLAALVVNVVVEWLAIDVFGWWSYTANQPTVPGLGTGLFAILQAVVLPPLTLYLLARWHRRAQPSSR